LIIPEGNEESRSKLMDVKMLVMTGGRERTVAEFDALFQQAGFNRSRVLPTDSSSRFSKPGVRSPAFRLQAG
jgi:hypothetical protein